ncbi:MAG: ABC transporter substrate-binding protein [Pseudolabrys sp.]|nr:ABC transporter substrate-binding protein [Pseudolabrys sp.]
MIRRSLATLSVIAALLVPAAAQERVKVGTQRLIASGPLFLADARGYFKAEGLEVAMTAYAAPQLVVEGLAGGATDLALAEFTATAFNLAGQGKIKAIAAQAREKRSYEGNEIVASVPAAERGLRKPENLANTVVGVTQLGSPSHYQFGQIARHKGFDFAGLTVKQMQTLDGVVHAVRTGAVDAAIVPAIYARELMVSNQARLVGWYSDIDEQQLGALFASAAMLKTRRAVVEKFVRAYRRGIADYAAMLRLDRYNKRVTDEKSQAAAAAIARYVYPGRAPAAAVPTVEVGAFYIEPQAAFDVADIERQIAWYKAQGLVESGVDAGKVIDSSFK